MIEGGIRMPRQPPAATTPEASFTSYPARSIAGKASSSIKVTIAPTMPVAVANSAQVTRVATARLPGMLPDAICKERNSRSRIFARSMI